MWVDDVFKTGKSILSSNEPINALRSTIDARITANPKIGEKLGIKDGKISDWARAKSVFKNDDGSYSPARIAGAYMGVSSVGRIATGGGIFNDSNGNPDLIGVPFI